MDGYLPRYSSTGVLHLAIPNWLIVIFSVNIVRAEIRLRKTGVGGIKGWYKSFSSSGFGQSRSNSLLYTPIKFYYMNCGNEHRKIACPNCGSKAVKQAEWFHSDVPK